MQLYLMRHGQAETPVSGGEAELTEAGRQTVEQQTERFAALLEHDTVTLARICHSGKKRAAQTAEIVSARVSPTLKAELHSGLKPNDEPRALLTELQNLQQPTLLVSHLPFIPTLVSLLTGKPISIEFESIPAGTLIALQHDSSGWHITSILTA